MWCVCVCVWTNICFTTISEVNNGWSGAYDGGWRHRKYPNQRHNETMMVMMMTTTNWLNASEPYIIHCVVMLSPICCYVVVVVILVWLCSACRMPDETRRVICCQTVDRNLSSSMALMMHLFSTWWVNCSRLLLLGKPDTFVCRWNGSSSSSVFEGWFAADCQNVYVCLFVCVYLCLRPSFTVDGTLNGWDMRE